MFISEACDVSVHRRLQRKKERTIEEYQRVRLHFTVVRGKETKRLL